MTTALDGAVVSLDISITSGSWNSAAAKTSWKKNQQNPARGKGGDAKGHSPRAIKLPP